MRSICLVAALTLAAAAASAGDDPGRALRGKWTLDKALMAEAMPVYATVSPAEQKALKEKLSQMPDARFEITDTQISFAWFGQPADTATYRVVASKGSRLELEVVSRTANGKDEVSQTTAEIMGPDVVRLTMPDAPITMVLRRVK